MEKILFVVLIVAAIAAIAMLGPRQVMAAVLAPVENYVQTFLVCHISSRDMQNNIKAMLAVAPVTLGATGVNTGRIIDRRGYGGVEFLVEYGAVTTTGSNVAVTMYEGDVTGTMTSVADADMIGTEALAGLLAGSTARASGVGKLVAKRVGYKGNKRYVRIDLNGTGTTSAGIVAASAVLHTPEAAPVSNP